MYSTYLFQFLPGRYLLGTAQPVHPQSVAGPAAPCLYPRTVTPGSLTRRPSCSHAYARSGAQRTDG